MNTELLERIEESIKCYPEITLAIVFGSFVTGKQNQNSDIDIAILSEPLLSASIKKALIEDLALLVGRPVDLIELAHAGQPLLGQILDKGERLFGSDTSYAKLITRNVLDRADFLPYRNRILEERRRAWIGT